MEWLSKLDTKDVIPISISIMAFSFSAISTYIALRRKKYETQCSLRDQLTHVLEKITALNVEYSKLPTDGSIPLGTPPNIRALLTDQRRFLVRQATYLREQIPSLVSPFEDLLIAVTYDFIDDVYQAEKYFMKAIENADDEINRGIITRSYARFLFTQGEHDLAREQYTAAVEIFSGDTDRMKEHRGDTYLRWATQEFEWSNFEEAKKLFEEAKSNFAAKFNPVLKWRSLNRLGNHIKQIYLASASQDETTDANSEEA